MNEWRRSTWGEEVSLEYGKSLADYSDKVGDFRVFGTNGPIGWTDRPLAAGPGVVLGRKGAYRGVEYSPAPFFVIDTAYYVVPKTDLDMRWVYYAVIHYQLGLIDDGSPVPSTTRAAVYQREMVVPSPGEQGAIAGVLGSLDDKIEHNHQTMRALERLAQAVFRAWFVDFEPVKAKAAGASAYPSMPQVVFDAMPMRVVDSNIGPVPEGWKVSSVYDLADVTYGAPFGSKLFNDRRDGFPLIRIRDLRSHDPAVFTTEEHKNGTLIRPANIVVGMDAEFRLHYWLGPDAWLNQRLCTFEPKAGIPRMYLGEALRGPLAYFERAKSGTTVIHLGKADIDTFCLALPEPCILNAFARITDPLLEMITRLARESRELAAMRDYLLPKLFRREVRTVTNQVASEGAV